MTIHDKFDKILKVNKLGIKSIYGLEKYCKVGIGSISKFLNKNESPTLGTIKTIQDVININPEWWESGEGEIFIVKGTLVPELDKKNTDRGEISILIKNLNRIGDFNEHLMQRVRDLEDFIKKHGLLPPA